MHQCVPPNSVPFNLGGLFVSFQSLREEFISHSFLWLTLPTSAEKKEVSNECLFFKLKKIFQINFCWCIVALQCCITFCCTAKWISYMHLNECLKYGFERKAIVIQYKTQKIKEREFICFSLSVPNLLHNQLNGLLKVLLGGKFTLWRRDCQKPRLWAAVDLDQLSWCCPWTLVLSLSEPTSLSVFYSRDLIILLGKSPFLSAWHPETWALQRDTIEFHAYCKALCF